MSALSRYRRQIDELLRRPVRLPTFETPVSRRPDVSRRALVVGVGAFLAANTLPKIAKAEKRVLLLGKPGSTMPVLQPLRVADGGSYTGAAGTGYSSATLGMLLNVRNNATDSTVAKRGTTIPYRPEMGYLGRRDTATAGVYTDEAIVAPVMHCVTHPVTDEMFATDQVIGVEAYAAALDGILGGVASVDFFCESDTPVNVPLPTVGTIPTWAGTKFHGMFLAKLLAAAFNAGESANIYMRANPMLAGLGVSPRVIGPFRFYRKALAADNQSPVPDLTLYLDTSAAGLGATTKFGPAVDNVTYFADPRTIITYLCTTSPAGTVNATGAAGLWNDGSGANSKAAHVTVKCADGCAIDFATPFSTANNNKASNRRGRIVFDATGGASTLFSSQWVTASCHYGTIDWTGWTMDVANIFAWEHNYSPAIVRLPVFRKCEITSSQGMFETPGSYGVGSKSRRGYLQLFPQAPGMAFIACWLHDCNPTDLYQSVLVGCKIGNMPNDVADIQQCQSGLNWTALPKCEVGTDYYNINGADIITAAPAMKLTYSGSGGSFSILGSAQNPLFSSMITLAYTGAGTPTYDIGGSHGNYVPSEGGRSLTLKVNGAAVKTFTYGQNGIFTFGDLFAAINAYGSGWAATGAGSSATTTAATFSGSISGTTLTVNAGSVTGALAVGQTIFTADGTVLTSIKALGTGTGGAGTYVLNGTVTSAATSFGAATSGTILLASKACINTLRAGPVSGAPLATSIGHFDTRTLVLNVDGVAVKSFPTLSYPGGNSTAGSFYFEDFSLQNSLTPIGSEPWAALVASPTSPLLCPGLATAVNTWANGNGWSASTIDQSTGGLYKGTRLNTTQIAAPISYGRTALGATNAVPYALFLNVPLSNPVSTASDAHIDFGQAGAYGSHENALISSVTGLKMLVQALNFGSTTNYIGANLAYVNVALQQSLDSDLAKTLYGQVASRHRHMIVAHSTLPEFQISFRDDAIAVSINGPLILDEFSRIVSNVFSYLYFSRAALTSTVLDYTPSGTVSTVAAQVRRNILVNKFAYTSPTYLDDATLPATVQDNAYLIANPGGLYGNLSLQDVADFPTLGHGHGSDFPVGDTSSDVFTLAEFVPVPNTAYPTAAPGPLRLPANLRKRDIIHDANGNERAAVDIVGAFRSAA